jgi:hypothetical protein
MKCVDCGSNVGNWPHWLEDSNVTVRCTRCSVAGATPINVARVLTSLAPLNELSRQVDELVQAA